MEFKIHKIGENGIAEVTSDTILFGTAQDALDLMMNCLYSGHSSMIIRDQNLSPAFFDLKTGIAGEILQKFSTYNMRLAIVGDFSRYPGASLRDFIKESNKFGRINFVESAEEAIQRLSIP